MAALPPMPNLLAFEAVARRRSFALAAAELHLTASAISHQIARLEAHLGIRLFERSAHGVRLSAAGEQYLSRVAGALVGHRCGHRRPAPGREQQPVRALLAEPGHASG